MMSSNRRHPLTAYWVVPGKLMAGEYPADYDEFETQERLRWLLERGVNSFLDLTEEGEYGFPTYLSMLEKEPLEDAEVGYQRRAIPDMGVPTDAEMKDTLDVMDGMLEDGHTVYVHCFGGKGRTGTVVGCWLVRHGLSSNSALIRINELRQNLVNNKDPSPETGEQVEMVRNWVAAKETGGDR